MSAMHVVNASRSTILGSRVRLLDNWWKRLKGFLGSPAPEPGEGVILTPCTAVHMYGMRYPLDVVFLDDRGVVVALYPELSPGSRTRVESRASHALELPSGAIATSGTELGDRVSWKPANNASSDDEKGRWGLLGRKRERGGRSPAPGVDA